jgi:hypothetical protein
MGTEKSMGNMSNEKKASKKPAKEEISSIDDIKDVIKKKKKIKLEIELSLGHADEESEED